MAGNTNYYQVLDLAGVQQLWDTCKATFVRTVNGNGIDANGNVQIAGIDALSIYPVGSIYMSVNNTSPANLFGGTWQQLKDRFLLGAGDTYTNGATGGEATHVLTTDEIPSHNHDIGLNASTGTKLGWGTDTPGNYAPNLNSIANTGVYTGSRFIALDRGGGQAHNNMPPYLVVYIWKRIS